MMKSAELRSLLSKLNNYLRVVLKDRAAEMCRARNHYETTIEHLLIALLEEGNGDIPRILRHFVVDASAVARACERQLDEMEVGNLGKPRLSPLLTDLLESSLVASSLYLNQTTIRSGAFFSAFLESGLVVTSGLEELVDAISPAALHADFAEIIAGSVEDTKSGLETIPAGDLGQIPTDGSILALYAENLTTRASEGEIDPILGRDPEIEQMIQILSRRRKSNPIMLGEPGVGKTAVVEGLALRVAEGQVPEGLDGVQIHALDMGALLAGTKLRGEFEQRLKGVINEVSQNAHANILFIDEVHTVIGAGNTSGGGDAANLLKPALARGEFRVIAATTFSEYNRYFSKDPALERRFQPIEVAEPDDATAITMLRGIKSAYEQHHGVHITDAAVESAVKLSRRYIAGRHLPDKAIDLLDTCATSIKMGLTGQPRELREAAVMHRALLLEIEALETDSGMGVVVPEGRADSLREQVAKLEATIDDKQRSWQEELALVQEILDARLAWADSKTGQGDPSQAGELRSALDALQGESPSVHADVTPQTVAQVVETWTGIPVGNLTRSDVGTLQVLEEEMRKRVVGQDHAIIQVANAIRQSKVGLGQAEGPLGVFLFLGTSGVGKTELARAVAEMLFGDERFMVTLNMTEYSESASISRLIGAEPGLVGYGEGGALTDPVRRRPYSVILLDEIEKAHSSVIDLFMQVFDRGMLTDSQGRFVDFSNTLVFMTSNASSDLLLSTFESGESDPDRLLERIRGNLQATFRPWFLGRVTPVVFLPLARPVVRQIVEMKLDRLAQRMKDQNGMELVFSHSALDAITGACVQAETGARTIDAIVNRNIASVIAKRLLDNMADGVTSESLTIDCGEMKELTYTFA